MYYTVETDFGTWDDITITKREYGYEHTKGRIALQLDSYSEGPFATLSVNLVDEDLTNDTAIITRLESFLDMLKGGIHLWGN